MKVVVGAIGRPGRPFARPIEEYERRAGRYWPLEIVEVKAERTRKGQAAKEVRTEESARLLARVPDGIETVALTRDGARMNSTQLSRYLQRLAVRSHTGAMFLIGGAFGLSAAAISASARTLSLSSFTLPHDLARLVLAEQLYRAGTIARNEPYHKARA